RSTESKRWSSISSRSWSQSAERASTTQRFARRSTMPATKQPDVTATATDAGKLAEVQLDLQGMTCASCAARIEKKLSRLDGVEATVNFATERATVRCEEDVAVERLVGAVEAAGYHARVAPGPHEAHSGHHHDEPLALLTRRLGVAIVLTVPIVLLSMVPPLRFSGWEWVALVLSTPVVLYSGIGFHRAALKSARHLEATMDTLISLGTLAAWTWSTVVLVGGIQTETY